jgi:hypothetical protein
MFEPEYILSTLESLEKKNEIQNGMTFSTRQYFFVDPMIPYENGKPGVGNKLAFERFIHKQESGYYVSMDCNDMKIINKINHIMGDVAIKRVGRAFRDASLETTFCKLFRSGGDEFLLYSAKKENVFLFTETALKNVDEIEPINNTHKITVSFGIGNSYYDAEDALLEAKKKKNPQVPMNIVHSNLPE